MLQADQTGDKALNLAREIFSSNAEKPEQFAALKKASDAPPARFESKLKGDELPAWQSVTGEVQMLLTLISYRAAARVDEEWKNRAPSPGQRNTVLSPQQTSQMIERFAQGTLTGFVNEADRKPKQVLGVTLPLSRQFQARILNQAGPDSSDGKPIKIGTVELVQSSTFGMVREGPSGTTLEITCGTESFKVSSRGQSRVDRLLQIVAVPDQCIAARVKISLPESELSEPAGSRDANRAEAPRMLVKSYDDQVLAKLAEDFRTGAKTFTLADFKPSYTQEEWDALSHQLKMMGINQVRVFAAVTLSPEMEQRTGTAGSTESLPDSIIE